MKLTVLAYGIALMNTIAVASGPTKLKYADAFEANNEFLSVSKSQGSNNEQLAVRVDQDGNVGLGALKTFGAASSPGESITALFPSDGNNEGYGEHPQASNTTSLVSLSIYSGGAPGYFSVDSGGACTGDCNVKIVSGVMVWEDSTGQGSTNYSGNCGTSEFEPDLVRALVHKTGNNTIGWAEGLCYF